MVMTCFGFDVQREQVTKKVQVVFEFCLLGSLLPIRVCGVKGLKKVTKSVWSPLEIGKVRIFFIFYFF